MGLRAKIRIQDWVSGDMGGTRRSEGREVNMLKIHYMKEGLRKR